MRTGTLSYGLLRRFGGIDSLLFVGDRLAVRRFAEVLRELSRSSPTARISLDDPATFLPRRTTSVVLLLNGTESRVEVVTDSSGKLEATWRLSTTDALESADALEALAASGRPGHQYLEKAGDIQIIVSMDEYDGSIFD